MLVGFRKLPGAFNLSILECKSCINSSRRINIALLISPYWNVNHGNFHNKSIFVRLLISPYWNVNEKNPAAAPQTVWLLISPYWNVNMMAEQKYKVKKEPFNLSILECKCAFA